MNIGKLALALGLAETAAEDQVFAKAASVVTEGAEAKKKFDKLSTDHAALVAEVEKQGFKVDGTSLSLLAPLKLDLAAKDGDDEEKKALKAALLASETGKSIGLLSENKKFVKQLADSMKLPPALMSLAEECLSVREEVETLSLSKDGKGVELKKCKDFPAKVKTLLEALSSMKGVKFATKAEVPNTDADAEKLARQKAYDEHFAKHADAGEKKPEEALATK